MKNRLKYIIALILSKCTIKAIRAIGKSKATSAPGMLAMKIYPDFIKDAVKNNKEKIITVTGTNGKTTTTGILAHIIKTAGKNIVHNTEGANMLSGIATALANQITLNKKSDYLIFESDEAYLQKLYDFISSDYLIITNLFRDQLDRYGELDITYKKIKEAIEKNKELKVLINADDPTLENIASCNEKFYYGINNIEYKYSTNNSLAPSENTVCPNCGKPLIYDKRFFAHIGHYYCDCGYNRKKPDYDASVEIFETYSILKIYNHSKEYEFKINLPGLYNVYNALGSISMALENGIDQETIKNALLTYTSVFGRAEMRQINGKKMLIQLIKNPVGASEVIRNIQGFEKSKLLIILNDDYADGRDVSWIWDANFEFLQKYKQSIIVSGTRANDAALRLKYAGVDTNIITVEKNIQKALNKAIEITNADETLLVLPTYTALLNMQKILK
ncbi:DUF1727 domain-containing protein [bacterium]|nr:DUF1727 domain-containing protein [bacterium]